MATQSTVQPSDPRTNGTIRRENPREQGVIGVGRAIAWFTSNGYEVWVPIGEPERCDLVVEDREGRLLKVEVKTTTRKSRYGRYIVQIATRGGNRSWNGVAKTFDPDEVDLLYVLTDEEAQYVIPTEHVRARYTLNLGPSMERFRVAEVGPVQPPLAPPTGTS